MPPEKKTHPLVIVVGIAVAVAALHRRLPDRRLSGGDAASDSQPAGRAPPVRRDHDHLPEHLGARDAGADGPEGSRLPGFEFTNPIAVGPPGPAGNDRIVTGIVDASGASLLPAGFVKTLGADPDRSDTVKLGDYQAYRYRNLDPGGFDPALTLYAVPTDKGVVDDRLQADAAQAATFLPECERAASTLQLEGAKPYDLGLGKEYVDALNTTLDEADPRPRRRRQRAQGGRRRRPQQAQRRRQHRARLQRRRQKLDEPRPRLAADRVGERRAGRGAERRGRRVGPGRRRAPPTRTAATYLAGERAVKKAEKQIQGARALGEDRLSQLELAAALRCRRLQPAAASVRLTADPYPP